MSAYFLRQFAQQLIEEYPDDMSRVMVVLPTPRSRLFLLRHLHELKGGAFWAPQCMILPDWVRSMLPGRIGGELEMITAMFEQYRTTVGGSDSFESFLGWQSVAMRDFNDVDAATAEGKRVYVDLRNIREIEQWDVENWSFERNPLTDTQESFLRFWKQLGELYAAFTEWQDKEQCWTYSRAVRYLADHPELMRADQNPDRIYFVGLGAYSKAERQLIKRARERWSVELVWNLDSYYFDNKFHEAGKQASNWKNEIVRESMGDRLLKHAMRATVVKCGTTISQVLRAAEILATFTLDQLENTCVVVNDETALEPLLSAITDIPSAVNLAIGKPLQQTYLSRIAEELFVVRSHHLRKGKIYHKPFSQWIQMISASGFERSACDAIRGDISTHNISQITPDHLNEWCETYPTVAVLFRALESESTALDAVNCLQAFMLAFEPADDFIQVSRTRMLGVVEELQQLLQRYSYLNDDLVMHKFYQLVISRMKMHYQGEPIEGLQLLSLSETRALDFENILFLGANEEYFPGERFEQSFIPFDLRAFYHMTLPEDIDSAHSYTYHRLLHEAKDVYYLYSTQFADNKSGEPSRYIIQLMDELKRLNPLLEIREEVIGASDSVSFQQGVQATDFIRERITKLLAEGISPSAINKLVSCPLDFYYRYIAKLGEEKEVEDSMSSSKFGEIVHKVLEDFYGRFVGSYPTESDFTALRSQLTDRVEEVANELYGGRNLKSGIDYLSIRIAIEMLERYVDAELSALTSNDATTISRKVELVEGTRFKEYAEGVGGLPVPFKISGKIDRADDVAGVLHLIDYKTGKVNADTTRFKGDFVKLYSDPKLSKFLQLLLYIMMTRSKDGAIPVASFYSMRENGGSFVHVQDLSEEPIDHGFVDRAEEALGNFLNELLNRTSFEHNTQSKYCEYCFTAHG